MKILQTQIAKAASADFEDHTQTFLMPVGYEVGAGEFAIVDRPVYDEMIMRLKEVIAHLEYLNGENFNGSTPLMTAILCDTLRKAQYKLPVYPVIEFKEED